jgi:hypothetical protein
MPSVFPYASAPQAKDILVLMTATDLIVTSNAQSDVQIKSKLVGYWMSLRRGYLIQANGLC